MAHIMVNGMTNTWQLHPTVDPEAVSIAVRDALENGEVIDVLVTLVDSDAPVALLLNGAACPAVAIV